MAIEEVAGQITNSPANVVGDIAIALGSLGKWLQAIGILIVLWIILHIINWAINRKRLKELYRIKDDMIRVEGKIDKILENTKRK